MATKRTSRLPGERLTADLRGRFHNQLITWMMRSQREENYAPWNMLFEHGTEEWPRLFVELEHQFGDGHYQDRKEILDTVLGHLNRRVNLESVLRILSVANTECREALGIGKERDYNRRLNEHHRTVQMLERLTKRTLDSYQRLWEVGQEDLFSLGTVEELSPVPQLKALLAALSRDPLKEFTIKSPLRRPRAGRQPEPWLKRARQKLHRLGVRLDLREDLLMCVGLTRYRED